MGGLGYGGGAGEAGDMTADNWAKWNLVGVFYPWAAARTGNVG